MITFGLCGPLERIHEAEAAGFAYLEPSVTSVATLTDEEFALKLADARRAGIPTPAFNVLFPGTMLLLDKATTDEAIAAYLDKALARVKALGGQVVVFGSGRSRRVPEDMTYAEGFRRLVEVTRVIGDAAAKHDLTIVVEPLCRKECNIINSVAEGACLVAAAHHPNVKLLADYYHMAVDGEPCSDIVRVGGIAHAHIATKEGRFYPAVMEDGFTAFFRALKATAYDGRVSVEGGTSDFAADAPASIRVLTNLLENA
ncbi:MAG: sugar phosphate isomerase/epimerase family protein [Aristaeellaceae bacterium]